MARCTQGKDDNFVYFILDLNNNTLLSCEMQGDRCKIGRTYVMCNVLRSDAMCICVAKMMMMMLPFQIRMQMNI